MHVLHEHEDLIPELDFVALHGAEIAGNILYSRSRVEEVPTVTFGPLSVLPVYQGRGVGSALVRHTLPLCREMGFAAVLIYGNPAYYARFGFVPARTFDIRTGDNMYAAALLALELYPGALERVHGRFFESGAFETDVRAVEAFDRDFPRRESASRPRSARLNKLRSCARLLRAVNPNFPRSCARSGLSCAHFSFIIECGNLCGGIIMRDVLPKTR